MRKYGIDNFVITPVLIIEENKPENINESEIYTIQTLKPKYNMTKGGDGGDTSGSPNYKKSMKLYLSTRDNSKCASYGMKGKKQSKKWKESISTSNSCPVSCEGVIYKSVGEAQRNYPGINIRYRLESDNYPEFFRLRPKISRKNSSVAIESSIM